MKSYLLCSTLKSVNVFLCSVMKVITLLNTDLKMSLECCWKRMFFWVRSNTSFLALHPGRNHHLLGHNHWRAEVWWCPGVTAWLHSPLPNSSTEQWRMVVIIARYTLFLTSQYDVIFTFAPQRFGEVYWHNMHIILYALSLLVVTHCVTVMNINYYQRFKLEDRSKTQHSTLSSQ